MGGATGPPQKKVKARGKHVLILFLSLVLKRYEITIVQKPQNAFSQELSAKVISIVCD